MEHIDAILYINLKHRVDRKEHILHEISKICKDSSKIHRIDAIKREPGALGCTLSHIKAQEYALSHPEWNRILILEDDFSFRSPSIYKILDTIRMLCTHSEMDVGLFAYNHHTWKYQDTSHPSIKKSIWSQTASGYLLSTHYIPVLLENMKEAAVGMEQYGDRAGDGGIYCCDVHWSLLHPTGNWFATVPSIGYQYESYSDIIKSHANYGC